MAFVAAIPNDVEASAKSSAPTVPVWKAASPGSPVVWPWPGRECPKRFTQAKHERFVRKVYNRDEISKDAHDRAMEMRLCQVGGAKASKNALALTRRLRKRRKEEQQTYGGGNYSIPAYIVECESGGDYNAQNASGAYGAYQIMPEHWNGGVCSDLGRDPAGQDACASRIWNSSGPGAWACA